jgi:hypothetical protein
MSIGQFIINLFKKDRKQIIQKENERLKIELYVLEKLKKELEEKHSKN